jgi:hypothetical protein
MADEIVTGVRTQVYNQDEKYSYQIRKLKDAMVDINKQRDDAIKELEDGKKELSRLEKEYNSSNSMKRVKELEQELRSRNHRAVFDRIAKDKGVREDGLDDLYSLSGYKADGDIVDEAAVSTVIDEQKGKRAYLFTAPADPNAPPPRPEAKPGPASGQGHRPGGGTTGFMLPEESDPRWSDAKWQWEHRTEIADAINNRLKNGVV